MLSLHIFFLASFSFQQMSCGNIHLLKLTHGFFSIFFYLSRRPKRGSPLFYICLSYQNRLGPHWSTLPREVASEWVFFWMTTIRPEEEHSFFLPFKVDQKAEGKEMIYCLPVYRNYLFDCQHVTMFRSLNPIRNVWLNSQNMARYFPLFTRGSDFASLCVIFGCPWLLRPQCIFSPSIFARIRIPHYVSASSAMPPARAGGGFSRRPERVFLPAIFSSPFPSAFSQWSLHHFPLWIVSPDIYHHPGQWCVNLGKCLTPFIGLLCPWACSLQMIYHLVSLFFGISWKPRARLCRARGIFVIFARPLDGHVFVLYTMRLLHWSTDVDIFVPQIDSSNVVFDITPIFS